jgi:hypothetical protein
MRKLALALILLGGSAGLLSAQTPALITSWTTDTLVFPTGYETQMAGAAIVGDSLYLLGGNNNLDGDSVRIFKFNVNKYNGFIDQTNELVNLPRQAGDTAAYAYINAQTVTTGTAIYIAGGGFNSGGPNRNHATIVKLNSGNGLVDTITSAVFPTPYDPELGAAAITQAGYFYAFGGDSQSGTPPLYDTVVYAPILPNGDLGAFSSTLILPDPDAAAPTGWYFPAACAIGNYIIANPGIHSAITNANATNKVYVATTNPATGAVTAWTEQVAAALPVALYGTQLVPVNNTIFAIGGRTTGGIRQNVVYRATFNPGTGTLGAWTTVDAQLPLLTLYHCVAYSPQSRSLYLTSYRAYAMDNTTNLGIIDGILVSSPLFPRDTPPTATDRDWTLFN